VLVTGHNLDDEAATLFGNILHWDTEMLGRQGPVLAERVLDAGHKVLVRKVKPLVRLAERETAAYALLKGIDYVVEECPMVEGNTQHRYKQAITALEEASPGTKHQMYFGFLKRAVSRFADATRADDVVACSNCGAPTIALESGNAPGNAHDHAPGEALCSFCRTKRLALARRERRR
jgi:uncharacterized protein (TIGR00269 family)